MSPRNPIPTVSIVIPYFQKESGILHKTVSAVLQQTSNTDYEIVVVDDGSPIPAHEELADLLAQASHLRIICQENAGPGAARNRGLGNVSDSTLYVAFIDSDDCWVADFISDGRAAMEAGYDVFLGNSQRTDIGDTRFDWQADDGLDLNPAKHTVVDAERGIHAFEGDFFDFVVYRSNIIGPSAMMYRLHRAPDLLYNESIFNGQDRLFKLHLAKAVKRVSFSPKIYAHEGRGVNIFDSAGWGTAKSLRFLSSYITLAKTILREVPMNPRQRAYVQGQLRTSRYNLAASLLHLLRHRQSVDFSILMQTFRSDPTTLLELLPNMSRAIISKSRGATVK